MCENDGDASLTNPLGKKIQGEPSMASVEKYASRGQLDETMRVYLTQVKGAGTALLRQNRSALPGCRENSKSEKITRESTRRLKRNTKERITNYGEKWLPKRRRKKKNRTESRLGDFFKRHRGRTMNHKGRAVYLESTQI